MSRPLKETGNRKQEIDETPLIVIVGETASGKSQLAHRIAKAFGGEIISADSRTVYKGMDIGTAKPSLHQQAEVKYHGLGLIEPNETYTVADFQTYAKQKINQIRGLGKLPIMVGGSGLYIDSILFDYSFKGVKDNEKRRSLNNMSLEKLTKLAQNQKIEVTNEMLKNKRHLVSAIERGEVVQPTREQPNNTLIVGIKLARSSLRNNIISRVETMFKQGLRKEIDGLAIKYGWENEAMTGIGYIEFKPWYEGTESATRVKINIVQNTLRLAKKQRTWFKRNRFIEWFEDVDTAYAYVKNYLAVNRKQETGNR